jgi:hypothetical protein
MKTYGCQHHRGKVVMEGRAIAFVPSEYWHKADLQRRPVTAVAGGNLPLDFWANPTASLSR